MKKVRPLLNDRTGLGLHLGIWSLYGLFWGYMFITEVNNLSVGMTLTLYILAVQMLTSYFNVYYLIPTFLNRGKVVRYSVFLVVLWGIAILLVYLLMMGYRFSLEPAFVRNRVGPFPSYIMFPIFITLFSASLPTFILILYEKLKEANRIKQLEKETIEHELKFLKAQINPHFLFNSLNSIFQLIDVDTERAKEWLAKFSEMLRYHLYETSSERVPLALEIDYVRSYAAMEKLRKGKNIEVELDIQPDIGYLEVVPLVVLTFVENAFKHVSNWYDRPNRVVIRLQQIDDQLQFQCINTRDAESTTTRSEASGIGLTNVRKRLDLMYPDAYQLRTLPTDEHFQVDLSISLTEAYELRNY